MNTFKLNDFTHQIICDEEVSDAKVDFEIGENEMTVFLTAGKDRPRFVLLNWAFETDEELFVLGDAWERSYGDLAFRKLSGEKRPLPWYFAATDGKETFCFGVKTQPNAFVCFNYDNNGISAKIDCQNGGSGVRLNGRRLELCTFVFERYALPPFESLKEYCKMLCDDPVIPKEKIYGGNNWYYAYGKSSFDEIVSDARLQAELSEGIENRPFMVVDDGWQVNSCQGPYVANEKFRDMKALADEMKALGVRPGIWVRLLEDAAEELTDEMKILRGGERKYLDPTNEKVREYIKAELEKISSWGYELLKHDFSTNDLFGDFGNSLGDEITNFKDWHFSDETKTNAEITLDFYRLIRETCADMLIIGCNTVSHLCAGLVEINRTGDDTSGREWARTRKMGVNTLAFRLAQNGAFYVVDADCVGILDDNVPWEKNRQWLDVLSKSDTALFTSCAKLSEEEKADIKAAYREIQKDHEMRPIDIFENLTPSEWEIDGEVIRYNWD